MVDSSAIRILVALALTVWSPGWCCCSLLGGSCSPTAAASGFEAEGGDCCSGDKAAPAAPASARVGSPGTCCEPLSAPGTPDDDRESCGCGSHSRQFVGDRALTLTAAGRGGQADVDFLAPLAMARSLLPEAMANVARACRGSPHVPRADSLLAQRCLMTI